MIATEPTTAPTEYQAALAADNAWQAELERQFGRNAGDVRYTEEGRTGTALAPLYAEYRRACDAWHAKMKELAPVECDLCETSQPCSTTDDLTICADRPACEARCEAQTIFVCGACKTSEHQQDRHLPNFCTECVRAWQKGCYQNRLDPRYLEADSIAQAYKTNSVQSSTSPLSPAEATLYALRARCDGALMPDDDRDDGPDKGVPAGGKDGEPPCPNCKPGRPCYDHEPTWAKRWIVDPPKEDDEPAAEFYAAAQLPAGATYAQERAAAGEQREAAYAQRFCKRCGVTTMHVRYTDHSYFICAVCFGPTPIGPPPCDNRGGCPECDPAQEALADEEAIRIGALAMLESGITACTNCGGRHHPQRCPEIGATLVNWSSAPLSPVEALRLAVNKGVFGEKTLAILRASLEAADQEALIRAEQLAAAREHAGQTWETWQEERAQGSPF